MLIFITTGGSVWLKQWAEKNGEMGSNPDVGKYIGVYFALGIGGAGLVVVQTLILWIFCSIEVSNTDHRLHRRVA
jgi:ATP-binding cassette subfamily C (CFTR/MRP) protein 1